MAGQLEATAVSTTLPAVAKLAITDRFLAPSSAWRTIYAESWLLASL